MVNMQAPKGTTQVSIEQQVFNVLDNGTVQVPEPFVDTLKDIGFRIVPGRIVVTAEAAAAISAAAAKLNLPVPTELQLAPDPFAKFMNETSGGFHATDQDWTTVGIDASGYPVPKGSATDISAQPNLPERKCGSKEDAERRAKFAEERAAGKESAVTEKQTPEQGW